jgi:hypothetical protein
MSNPSYLLTPARQNNEYAWNNDPAAPPILHGAALSDKGSPGSPTGVADNLTAGENFLGFADEGLPAGYTVYQLSTRPRINVVSKGIALLLVAGVTAASVGMKVYAIDNATFTLTQGSNSYIGKVVEVEANGAAWVAFKGIGYQ